MKIKAALLLVLPLLSCPAIFAQNTDSLKLDTMIHKNTFKFNAHEFDGKGWNILKEEMLNTQMVLIGEQHGHAEIPVFTAKVAEVFKPKALVIEIDPYAAAQLKTLSINPAKYREYFKKNPYGFAFYSWETEMELARQMTETKIDIWGLNEINFLTFGNYFKDLAAQAKTAQNKAFALKKAKEYSTHDLPIFQDGNKYGEFSAYKMKMSTVDSLAFNLKNESSLYKKMLNDLRLSQPIFANGHYDLRTNLMKRYLLNYLAPYLKNDELNIPRLLFKFGANHVPRADDEVGSLADNLSAAVNKKNLHILIFGKQGSVNTMSPVDNNKAIKPYDLNSDIPVFKVFADRVNKDEWALFDLRPIRTALKKGTLLIRNKELKNYISGYDYLIIAGTVTGSKFIE